MAGKSLGALTLNLIMKTGGFTAPLTQAERKLGRSMSAMERRAEAFGRQIGTALRVGAGLAAAGLAIYIKNTIEAEKVQTLLEARVRALGSAAAASVPHINELATAIMHATVFDDEKIKSAATALLAFTNIKPGNFDRAIMAAADLATATGDDLVATAEKIGMALNNPLTAAKKLRAMGIELTASQKDLIKSFLDVGDAASAQAIVLQELEKRSGGMAVAARDTLGGALQALKVAFNELLEGDAGGGGMTGAREGIEQLISTLNDPGIKAGIGTIVSGLFKLATVATQVASSFAAAAQLIGVNIAEMVHQAKIAANINLQIATFGFAKGTIKEGLAESRRGYQQLTEENTALVKSFFGVREAKKKAFSLADFGAGKPQPAAVPKPTSGGGGGGGRSRRGGGGGGGRAVREMPDFAKEAREELERLIEVEKNARDSFDAMAAQLAGPLADAAYRFSIEQANLNEQARLGGVGADELATAQANLRAEYEKNVEAINAQLTPAQEVIAGLREEIELIGLSDIAQQKLIATRQAGAEATAAQVAEIEQLIEARDRANKSAQFQQELESNLTDAIYDFATGAKSAGEAAKDFFDSMAQYITRMIAESWAKKIGEMFMSSSSSSASTGGWGSFFTSLFGGGKAGGGWVTPGKFYEVGEANRPEMLMSGGHQYMIPGNQGRVVPMGGSGITVNNTFAFAQPYDHRTEQQAAQRVAFETSRAASRNR